MSVKLTRTFTRPNTTVSFWAASPETRAAIDAAYVATGKLLSVSRNVPVEGDMTQVVEYVFASVEALDEFATDPALFAVVQERDAHNATHGITNSHVVEQIA